MDVKLWVSNIIVICFVVGWEVYLIWWLCELLKGWGKIKWVKKEEKFDLFLNRDLIFFNVYLGFLFFVMIKIIFFCIKLGYWFLNWYFVIFNIYIYKND